MVYIKEIPVTLVYPVRQEVLRPGRPPEECVFTGDTHLSTFHLGLFKNQQCVAVASFMNTASSKFKTPLQYQLRGMAVLESHKGKGYGAALLMEGEKKLRKRETPLLLWFNARDYAVGFYEKYGYQTIGEKFDIPGVCEHIVMFKHL